jgi:predicted nucleic-acid-binding protein
MLETEWVLRHAYKIGKKAIMRGFQKMIGLPNISIEDQQTVFQAISWCESGLDFADALHLASSLKADKFVTFDSALIKKARKFISIDITTP